MRRRAGPADATGSNRGRMMFCGFDSKYGLFGMMARQFAVAVLGMSGEESDAWASDLIYRFACDADPAARAMVRAVRRWRGTAV